MYLPKIPPRFAPCPYDRPAAHLVEYGPILSHKTHFGFQCFILETLQAMDITAWLEAGDGTEDDTIFCADEHAETVLALMDQLFPQIATIFPQNRN